MKIGLITTHLTIEEKALEQAAVTQGFELDVLEVSGFVGDTNTNDPQILYRGERVEKDYDIVIPRIDPPIRNKDLLFLGNLNRWVSKLQTQL